MTWRFIQGKLGGWSLYAPEEACCILYLWEWFSDAVVLEELFGMGKFADIFGGAGKPEGEYVFTDEGFQQQYPTCYELLACTKNDEGKRRKTCTLTMVAEDGMVKVGLKERDHDMSLWTSSETIGGAFAALEEALGERPVKWRKVEWKGRSGRNG